VLVATKYLWLRTESFVESGNCRWILGDKVEILAGLSDGEQVITTGQINLQEGTKVEVINKSQVESFSHKKQV
jgi:hypothetical protein